MGARWRHRGAHGLGEYQRPAEGSRADSACRTVPGGVPPAFKTKRETAMDKNQASSSVKMLQEVAGAEGMCRNTSANASFGYAAQLVKPATAARSTTTR